MLKRFNFTKRKRIEKERIVIELIEPSDDGATSFDATRLDLDGKGLPPDAPVTIEAYRGRSAMRFPWGQVGALSPPAERRLVNVPDNPSFRVKVVAADGSGALLALANRVRPYRKEHHGALVWLNDRVDLGKEVWRLDFGNGNPTLQINRAIAGIGAAVQKDGAFRGLVMPEVLRAVLVRAIIIDDADPEDEEGEWTEMMGFVRSFYDEPLPPDSGDGDRREHDKERMAWIDEAVKAFAWREFPASDFYAAAIERQ